ncbi:EZY14 [Auxenochlorella protothecoides x Auxenochlorella symbiontica]
MVAPGLSLRTLCEARSIPRGFPWGWPGIVIKRKAMQAQKDGSGEGKHDGAEERGSLPAGAAPSGPGLTIKVSAQD